MVTMVSGKPMTAMERGHAAGDGGLLSNAARPLLPVRLTRRGRVVAAGVSALAIGALSIALGDRGTGRARRPGRTRPVRRQG